MLLDNTYLLFYLAVCVETEVTAVMASSLNLAGVFLHSNKVVVKLIFHKRTRRIGIYEV